MVNRPCFNLVLGSQNRLRAAKRFSSVLSKTKRSFEKNTIWLFYTYLNLTYTVLKTSANTREKEKWRTIFFFHHPKPLALAVFPRGFYFLSRALDGLWRENRGSVNRLYKRRANLNFCSLPQICDVGWFLHELALKCCHFPPVCEGSIKIKRRIVTILYLTFSVLFSS